MMGSTCFGSAVWLVFVWLALRGKLALWVIEPLFLLAPLVLVPLALPLIEEPDRFPWVRRLQPSCALAAAASFALPRGVPAAALAAVWLAFTGLLALHGLERLRARGFSVAAEVAVDAALFFLPVGGGWLVLSRLGARPLGFDEPIVLLTAVHFHYAAFTALVLTGLVGRALGPSALYRGIVTGAIVGTPLLAAGITVSPLLELVGAGVLATAFSALAVLVLVALRPRIRARPARAFLTVSALSLLPAMACALAYAWGEFTQGPVIALSWMARIHGTANALGFGLCGLLGWTLAARATPTGRSCKEE